MSQPIPNLISSSSSFGTLPPNCLSSPPPPPPSLPFISVPGDENKLHRFRLNVSRREAAAAVSVLSAFVTLLPPQPPPATAFSLGISGPKDWLREQKKKSSRFLLAPIDASRNGLRFAYQLLMKGESEINDEDIEEVRRILNITARDCVLQDRSSLVSFQAKSGVEVCTFRLVVNNASSLLDDKDPIKLGAEASLVDLIRSFTSLNAMTSKTSAQSRPERQKVTDALMDTISSLDKFEQGIKNCLEI